jgi:peptidoglycan/xylan/chitin deacetylase (PgdA/CDA1 family)
VLDRGASLAVNFVVNYEKGGERSVPHDDKVAKTRLTDLFVPAPLQGARDLNMESAYEYGSRVGFWRLMRVFAERQVIPTIYAVGMALERNPQAAERQWRVRAATSSITDGAGSTITASTKQPSESISASPSTPFGD